MVDGGGTMGKVIQYADRRGRIVAVQQILEDSVEGRRIASAVESLMAKAFRKGLDDERAALTEAVRDLTAKTPRDRISKAAPSTAAAPAAKPLSGRIRERGPSDNPGTVRAACASPNGTGLRISHDLPDRTLESWVVAGEASRWLKHAYEAGRREAEELFRREVDGALEILRNARRRGDDSP